MEDSNAKSLYECKLIPGINTTAQVVDLKLKNITVTAYNPDWSSHVNQQEENSFDIYSNNKVNKFISEVTNEDCMEGMARYPDKYFDLAIVDPPYGILNKTKRGGDHKFNMEEYSQWDVKPNDDYFNELIRVSKNQIIWGGNYFGQLWLRSEYNKGFIIWDKNQPETLNNFSMTEMAWSSLDKPSKIFRYSVRKNRNKIHPTQKPVELYEWLLKMYAKQGDKILDTHLGSGSSRIAAYEMRFDFTAFELDTEYFEAQEKRYKAHVAQLKMELL